MTNEDIHGELCEPLSRAVMEVLAEPVSKESEQRTLAAGRGLSDGSTSPDALSPKRVWSRRALGLFAVLAATLLLMVLWPRNRTAWAEIIESLAQKSWIQMSGVGPDQQEYKRWYSVEHRIIAVSHGEDHLVFDLADRCIDTFARTTPFGPAREPGKIYRTAITEDNRRGIDFAKRSFEAMLAGDVHDMPSGDVEIVSHEKRNVVHDGMKLVEHRFTTKRKGGDTHQEVTLLVDAETSLPVSLRQSERDGTEMISSVTYPDSGPKDIYDLGVPRTTELVDLRPQDDVQRVINGLRKSRTEMDTYCAISTSSATRNPLGRPSSVYRTWKRQTKWRIEQGRTRGPTGHLPAGTDAAQWWHQHIQNADASLVAISDGERECTFKPIIAKESDPKNPSFRLIKSYQERSRAFTSPNDPISYQNNIFIPDFVGYPRRPYEDCLLEPNPTDGPGNTIRVEVRETNGTAIRYWMDPNRGYLVMRLAALEIRDNEYVVSTSTDTLEVIQTPSGKWLPTLIRNNAGAITMPKETLSSLPKEMVKDGRLVTEEYYDRYFYRFDEAFSNDLFVIEDP